MDPVLKRTRSRAPALSAPATVTRVSGGADLPCEAGRVTDRVVAGQVADGEGECVGAGLEVDRGRRYGCWEPAGQDRLTVEDGGELVVGGRVEDEVLGGLRGGGVHRCGERGG